MAWKVTVKDESDDFDDQTDEADLADDDLDYDYEDESYDDQRVGLFATPGRTIALVSSGIVLVFVLGIAVWLLATRQPVPASGASNLREYDPVPAVRVGSIAPDFQLNDLYSGKSVKLSSFRGKPLWVNFWATWCTFCKIEMPEMKQRYDKFKDKDLAILGVDLNEDNNTVKQYVQQGKYDWNFVIDPGPVNQQYFVTGLPTHVFIDKNGVIRSLVVGGINGDQMDESLAKIISQ